MDREMQMRLYEPYRQQVNCVRLTEFPLIDQFVNPGVGISMYDFLVPMHGKESYENKKSTELLPGSLKETPEVHPKKDSSNISADLKQEGFGLIENSETSLKDLSPQKGLDGSILNAMKHAKIKTSELKYTPSVKKIKEVQRGQKKNSNRKDKFKFI